MNGKVEIVSCMLNFEIILFHAIKYDILHNLLCSVRLFMLRNSIKTFLALSFYAFCKGD